MPRDIELVDVEVEVEMADPRAPVSWTGESKRWCPIDSRLDFAKDPSIVRWPKLKTDSDNLEKLYIIYFQMTSEPGT